MMPGMIYATPQAGLNAYQLMEELSETFSPAGWVELRKTTRSERDGEKAPPPVYQVAFKPNFWNQISAEMLTKFQEIADRYQAKISVKAEASDGRSGAYVVVVFEHEHRR